MRFHRTRSDVVVDELCVVDPSKRTVYLYSSEGDEKVVECDTVDEFMNVLSFVRDTCPEERLSYANPLPK